MLTGVLAPMLGRASRRCASWRCRSARPRTARSGSARSGTAGAERIFVWPLADELEQLERFRADVVPLVI